MYKIHAQSNYRQLVNKNPLKENHRSVYLKSNILSNLEEEIGKMKNENENFKRHSKKHGKQSMQN